MAEWTLKENSQGDLVITISGDEWEKACAKAFTKLAGQMTLPGFRKGRAPEKLLKKYITDEHTRFEAIEKNATEWFRRALEETGIEPIDQPSLDFRNMSDESVDLVFTFHVEPEAVLGTYTGLPYELGDVTVSEEDVDKEIDRMRDTYADMETVEGEAADGDTVNIDYEGFSDGVPFERGKEEGRDLVLGSGTFVPGFEEQLIGVKAGDEKEINVTFPEDYASEELAGKPVVFKVKVNEVKRKVVPALDDDFAKDVSVPGVETVEDLRRTVRERLEASRKEAAEREADTALLALLRENCEIDLPQVMIENEAMAMVKQTESQIMQYGMDPAQYLKMMGQTEETLAKSYMEDAEKAVRTRLALKAIVKAENIEVTDEEIDAELKELATQLNMDLDAVKKAVDLELVRDDLAGRKALEFLKENAAKN